MSHPLDAQEQAVAEAATLRRQDAAARLARAIHHKQLNPELSFATVAKLFRIGEETLKSGIREGP